MAEHSSRAPASGLLQWLGFRGGSAADAHETAQGRAAAQALQNEARKHLLDSISHFLLGNGLEISAANLLTAHGAISGADQKLAMMIEAQLKAGERVTQAWLDEITTGGDEYAAYRAELETLMAKLESGIESFTTTTKAAQSATGDYNAALEEHVEQVEKLVEPKQPEQVLSGLADLAKAMLARTRQIEDEIRKSELEAKSLRRSLAKAKRDADIDHLTGLPNRRAFEALLDEQYKQARASVEPLCVAFCDIDHFKHVNDTHGHETGDRVIKVIAQSLARISNQNCHVARHGGEEFVMLFRGMTPDQVFKVLDETRENMAQRKLVNRMNEEPLGTVTFSGGIADVFACVDPRAALRAADVALYRAKAEGRNRILLAEPEEQAAVAA
jgi:diguanylate cyclase